MTLDPNDVEAVARAICVATKQCKYIGEKCNTSRCAVSPEVARAAIEAVGQPEVLFGLTHLQIHEMKQWATMRGWEPSYRPPPSTTTSGEPNG